MFWTRLFYGVLEDVVEDTVADCPEAVEEGVEVPFAGKHREVYDNHH